MGEYLNILIVDDDAVHGRSVRDLLAAHKYPADVSSSGQEGLRMLLAAHESSHPYEVLILDLHIPDLPGLDILTQISKHDLKVKTIVLSGERELSTVAPIIKLGAYDYLTKPFQPDQLTTCVANALGHYNLEFELASMQQQADENAKLYEFLLNASPDLIYMLNENGEFQFINKQLATIFDASYNNLSGQSWQSLFANHEELAKTLRSQFNERRTGVRATIAEEFDYVTEVGTTHTLELSAIGLYEGRTRTDTGEFLGTYGIVRDVTESKRTSRQLKQSQQKFYSLFMDSPDAIFIVREGDGLIVERNPNFIAMWDSISQDIEDNDSFLWTEDYPREKFINGVAENPDHYEFTYEKQVLGVDRFFEIRARRLYLEGEQCIMASLRDRTQERTAEQQRLALQEQLQQAGRMEAIGQVAGGIAHDFNNILASIIGYAELIMNARNRLGADQVSSYLGEVVTAGHRARDLISQMLTFTRARRGEPMAVNITQSIADVSRMLRAAIPTTIELRSEFADDLPSVLIDPVQIQQIVINLLINARDAIVGNGTINIDVQLHSDSDLASLHRECRTCGEKISEDQVVITVKDTGHGIPEGLIDRVFDMHFTTRAPDKGTGLGLWMINNMVHEHGGHLQISSEEQNGTEFRIYLPASYGSDTDNAQGAVPIPQIDGRIIVVDDEVSVANFVGEVLRDKGYPTVVFTESPQALKYLEEQSDHVSLLITDGNMPLISGRELADFAKSTNPNLPVVFITAYKDAMETTALQAIGVDAFLNKPFSINEMMQVVARLLENHEASAESS